MIVDDMPTVGRALARVLGKHFDETHVRQTAAEAESLLSEKAVTHVICDYCLGGGDPLGVDLLPRWRREHPAIERALLITGYDENAIAAGPEINAVVSKLASYDELATLLNRR